jgi:DNA-binding MarR family transcriptional regulator
VTQTSSTEDGVAVALAVLRTMVGIADSTVEHVTKQLTLTQFHTLRTVAERTPVTVGAVAQELAMNPSSVTRACERLAGLGLLDRAQNPLNRREVLLAPTRRGRQLVERVSRDRENVLSNILDHLAPDTRAGVVDAFTHFAASATRVWSAPPRDAA